MEKKKRRHYPENHPVKMIFDGITGQHIGVYLKFPGKEMVQISRSALLDFVIAIRSEDTEMVDQFLKTVKNKLDDNKGEGSESV